MFTLKGMGVFDLGVVQPEQEPGESDEMYYGRMQRHWAGAYAEWGLADGTHPTLEPRCRACGLEEDRFPIRHEEYVLESYVLLERLEPDLWVESHTVPPYFRWMVDDGLAYWMKDEAPEAVDRCRVAHQLVCPVKGPPDPWSWVQRVRRRNERLMVPPDPDDEIGE